MCVCVCVCFVVVVVCNFKYFPNKLQMMNVLCAAPYDRRSSKAESSYEAFWVMPPPEVSTVTHCALM